MTGPAPRPGFALVAVLWALVILSGLALHFHREGRADRVAVLNAGAEATGRWAARAGLAHTLQAMDRRFAAFLPLGGAGVTGDTLIPPLELRVDRVAVRVLVLDHRARLNINTARLPELERLLAAVGFRPGEASALAHTILQWRYWGPQPDVEEPRLSIPRPTVTPGEGPFLAIEELRRVPGVDPWAYQALEPHITVSGDGRINVNTASLPVLMTLPGMDRRSAEQIIRRRSRGPYGNVFELIRDMPTEARQLTMAGDDLLRQVAFSPRTIAVVAEAAAPGAQVGVTLHATVELLGGRAVAVTAVAERATADVSRRAGGRAGPGR
jgi:general secretion pathway protein K